MLIVKAYPWRYPVLRNPLAMPAIVTFSAYARWMPSSATAGCGRGDRGFAGRLAWQYLAWGFQSRTCSCSAYVLIDLGQPEPQVISMCGSRCLCAGAFVSLGVGILVYAVDRTATSVFVLPEVLANLWYAGRGGLHDSLPTFFHTLAFLFLLNVVLTPGSPLALVRIVLFWCAMEFALELVQHDAVSRFIPASFADLPALSFFHAYALHGTYDALDMLAVAVAASIALVVLWGRTADSHPGRFR